MSTLVNSFQSDHDDHKICEMLKCISSSINLTNDTYKVLLIAAAKNEMSESTKFLLEKVDIDSVTSSELADSIATLYDPFCYNGEVGRRGKMVELLLKRVLRQRWDVDRDKFLSEVGGSSKYTSFESWYETLLADRDE